MSPVKALPTGKYLLLGAIALLILSVYFLSKVLIPFALGAIIAYLCEPLVTRLIRSGLSRNKAAIIVFTSLIIVICVICLLLVPMIQQQIDVLSVLIPRGITMLQERTIPWLASQFGIQETLNATAAKKIITENVVKTGTVATWFMQTVLSSGKAVFETLLYAVITPIVTFYFLRDGDVAIENLQEVVPPKNRRTFTRLLNECSSVLNAFFRGQLLVMLCVGVFYSIALSIVGLETGVLIGVIVGVVSIVPYLGMIIGIAIASIAALIQFGTFTSLLWIWAIFAVGHSIENMVLTPILIGDRIGLHPVLVIFTILAGGQLFGFIGVLLALPFTAVAMVLVKYGYQRYVNSRVYSG